MNKFRWRCIGQRCRQFSILLCFHVCGDFFEDL
ncbi:hypothetical protein GLYMA_07G173450v4 [Glycine max]|nr:hypothetical protein GLYMA_07G173450v4 [Glycine max]KAH1087295.1 hypothetical protein GYH30_018717 [Glycine max]